MTNVAMNDIITNQNYFKKLFLRIHVGCLFISIIIKKKLNVRNFIAYFIEIMKMSHN